jgi:hypothetical protein
MTIPSILLPVFIVVFLLFFLLGWTVKERMSGLRSGAVKPEAIALSKDAWQPKAKQVGNCLQNQFELPPLFYVLVILAIMMHKADFTFVIMEWIFVLSRLGHAYVFTTSNHPGTRGSVFLVGALTLFLMWVIFAIRILLFPTSGAL